MFDKTVVKSPQYKGQATTFTDFIHLQVQTEYFCKYLNKFKFSQCLGQEDGHAIKIY